ncbi:MAG: MarR family winged helix-turn-helix transcriptional regulator [Thermoplasmatota archaeon]
MVGRTASPSERASGAALPPVDEPWKSLRETHLALQRRYSEILSSRDLAFGEYLVLGLCAQSPTRPSQIAERVGITPAGTTDLVDRLERRGFVTRRASPEDRRTVNVELTTTGEREYRESKAQIRRFLSTLGAHVAAEDREALIRGLRAVLDAVAADATNVGGD